MTPRNALLAIHLGALMFGLSGVLGKLAESSALVITFGRALFAVLALLLVAQLLRPSGALPSWRQRAGLALGGLLLGAHWLTFFIAVKIAGVGIATLGFASFPAFTVLLEGLLFRERTRAVEFAMVGLVTAGLLLVAGVATLTLTAVQASNKSIVGPGNVTIADFGGWKKAQPEHFGDGGTFDQIYTGM